MDSIDCRFNAKGRSGYCGYTCGTAVSVASTATPSRAVSPSRKLKVLSVIGVTLLLALAAGTAISASGGIDMIVRNNGIEPGIQWLFEGWRGSRTLPITSAVIVILAIAGRVIEKH